MPKYAILAAALMLAGCSTTDIDKSIAQKIGLADKNKMMVTIDDAGTMCYGGEDLTSDQYKKACDDALAAKRTEIQRQQEAARIQAQKDEEAKNAAAADRAKRIAAVEAHPSRRLISYQVRIAGLYDSWANAAFARQCNLRSSYWFESLFEAIQLTKVQIANSSPLSGDELLAADDFGNKHYNSVVAFNEDAYRRDPPGTCQRFADSQKLRILDQMQLRATNNYH